MAQYLAVYLKIDSVCVCVCVHIQQCNRVQFLQGLHWSGIREEHKGERGHLNRCDALSLSLEVVPHQFLQLAVMTRLLCHAADKEMCTAKGGGRGKIRP